MVRHPDRLCQDGVVPPDDWSTAAAVLRLAGELVDRVQAGLLARGFDDVRPAHGFAFARIAAGGATNADVAAHLGITKQSASQLVEHLVSAGYVTREPHPGDARARLLALTPRGRACTRAAEAVSAEVVAEWRGRLTPAGFAALADGIGAVVRPGPLRITW
jgi:DNA-binding MarR family transcriptional regulator